MPWAGRPYPTLEQYYFLEPATALPAATPVAITAAAAAIPLGAAAADEATKGAAAAAAASAVDAAPKFDFMRYVRGPVPHPHP